MAVRGWVPDYVQLQGIRESLAFVDKAVCEDISVLYGLQGAVLVIHKNDCSLLLPCAHWMVDEVIQRYLVS